ncbi:MAG TPA: hypothetical protein VJ914_35400 [Pseudonocardiaceae bacterium]|nr:hypothetical protein [Pseudonocardiaceae bacterium]
MTRVRPRVLIVAVVVVAVLVGGIIVLVKARWLPWNDAAPCDLPSSVTTGPASDASDIRVAEQGFTQSADYRVSIGAILWNTGKDIAYRTRVSLQPFDSGQRPLGAPTVVEVPVLLPGERVGIGQDTQLTVGTHATSVRVVPDTTYRLSAGVLGSYQPVTATELRTSHPDPQFAGYVDIHYTDTSTNCGSLADGEAAVVYRDADGRVVGGAVNIPGSLIVYRDQHGNTVGGETHLPVSRPCQPGTRDMWITPDGDQPVTADPKRTAIYPYCGVPYSASASSP